MGCSKCGKNRGCNSWQGWTKERRKRFLEETQRDVKEQMPRHGYEAQLAPTKKASVKDVLPWEHSISAGMPSSASGDDSPASVAGSFCVAGDVEGSLDSGVNGWILV